MPVVEIGWFSASDSLKADHSLINPALDHVRKAEGCMNVYYGFVEEDKEMVCLAIFWETYEHRALTDHPNYSSLIKPDAGTIGYKMNHVELNGDTAAFTSPTTEIATATAKEGKSQEEFMAVSTVIGDMIIGAGHPVAVGEAREEQGKRFAIIGWESVKAHSDLISSEKFIQPMQKLQEVGDFQVVHVTFIKYA